MSDREHGTIHALGTSARSPQEFVGLLKSFAIEVVADVRRFPASKFEHFRKGESVRLLGEVLAGYIYLGEELSGYR